MGPLAPRAGTGEPYAAQVGELWTGLAATLPHLEALARDPGRLEDDERFENLRRLQYALHRASEHAYGLAPPAGTTPVHGELAAALAAARDATGEVVEAVETGGAAAAEPLVYEWRGALFRVRLARMRLAEPRREAAAAPAAESRPTLVAPLAALALMLAGTSAFVAGAALGLWPMWVAGIVAVCATFLIYKP
jgi:hypothetical protein